MQRKKRDYREIEDGKPKKEGGMPSLASLCMACIGILCSCCCCSIALMVIVLLVMLGPIGWTILGGGIAIFAGVFLLIYCLHQITFEGTTFTLCNYFLPMAKYGLISQSKGEQGVRDMWKSMQGDTPYVAEGFGPNTTTYFGWQEAKDMLSSWGARLANGTMTRHNELGLAIMGPGPWPETDTIALGFNREDHAVARPWIGRACDGGRVPEGPCDGSNGWNRTYLRNWWRNRFDNTDTFNTKDTAWMCTIILHKIHVNMDMSDEEAQEFMNFPSCLSFPGTGKVGVGLGNMTPRELCLVKYCTPVPCFQCKMQEVLDDLKDAIQAKWPQEDWDENKLTLVANMFNDSMTYAGGLSVPAVLQNMLAWWFSTENRPRDLDRVTAQDENSIKDFMWETMRRNPPVAGVPRWVTDDGSDWRHEVSNVEQAMQDERVFPDPMKFQMGRPGLNAKDYSRSMFWADFAIVNNDVCHPDTHACPGKMLSQEIIVAFWQEFLSRSWTTDEESISIGYNLTSTFDLTQS